VIVIFCSAQPTQLNLTEADTIVKEDKLHLGATMCGAANIWSADLAGWSFA
jgi:hypothetical protein